MNVGLFFELRVVTTISGALVYEYRKENEDWICGTKEMFDAWLSANGITY